MTHALFSPSAAHRWMRCPGSLVLESGLPSKESIYAREGTNAHHIAAIALEQLKTGKPLTFQPTYEYTADGATYQIEATTALMEDITFYHNTVMDYLGDGILFVEQLVNFSSYIGHSSAFGTSDAMILRDNELVVIDFKYGRGIEVSAEDNEQMIFYALGAYSSLQHMSEIEKVTCVIIQPRLNNISEWSISKDNLLRYAERARVVVGTYHNILSDTMPLEEALYPGEDQCRFCRAKSICPALRKMVTALPEEPVANDDVSNCMKLIPTLKLWIETVETLAWKKMMQGETIPDFKLIKGRNGARHWASEAQTQGFLSTLLEEKDFTHKRLMTPPELEKTIAKQIPTLWHELQSYITYKEGKPHIAPASDKREAVNPRRLK